jgi:hypothetical protein
MVWCLLAPEDAACGSMPSICFQHFCVYFRPKS